MCVCMCVCMLCMYVHTYNVCTFVRHGMIYHLLYLPYSVHLPMQGANFQCQIWWVVCTACRDHDSTVRAGQCTVWPSAPSICMCRESQRPCLSCCRSVSSLQLTNKCKGARSAQLRTVRAVLCLHAYMHGEVFYPRCSIYIEVLLDFINTARWWKQLCVMLG